MSVSYPDFLVNSSYIRQFKPLFIDSKSHSTPDYHQNPDRADARDGIGLKSEATRKNQTFVWLATDAKAGQQSRKKQATRPEYLNRVVKN